MKGMMLKDCLILGKQKKLAIIYVFVAVMLSFSMDSSFIVTYFSLIGSLLVLSTFSYDLYDNGYPFLMTLPVDAKGYVRAKYLFSLFGLIGFWLASVLLQFLVIALKKESVVILDTLGMDLAFFPAFLFIVALMIPITIKFGPDKCRIVFVILFGIIFVLGILGKKVLDYATVNLNLDVESIIQALGSLPKNVVVACMFVVGVAAFLLSELISIGIMKKKEY